MRDLVLPAFILALPPLAALGHDIYLAYNNTQVAAAERFYPSDLGWLWTEYSPDTYKWAFENFDETTWNAAIDPLLQSSAIFVLGAPLAAFILILLFMKIFGVGAFEGAGLFSPRLSGGAKKGDFSFRQDGVKKRMKYRRKG